MTQKLLVIIPGVIPTTEIILRTLRHAIPADKIKVVLQNELDLKEIFSGEYTLLFIRQCEPSLRPLWQLLKRFKIQYLYYIDDNFWELTGNTPLAQCYQNKAVRDMLTDFVQQAFHVIAGSRQLKSYLMRYTKQVSHIDAAFDFPILQGLVQNKKILPLKILYSGSLYRDADFDSIITAFKKIAAEYSETVTIHFNGFVPPALKELRNVIVDETFYPYEDYIKKQFQANYDIGIAPLSDSLSNRAKSNLKFREYGACHIAGIYTDIPPYSECVVDHQNGLLIQQTAEEWYRAIKELIDNPALRETIIDNAHHDVMTKYTHAVIAPEWQKILATVPANKKINVSTYLYFIKIRMHFLNLAYKMKRTRDYYRYYGLKITVQKIQQHLLGSRVKT